MPRAFMDSAGPSIEIPDNHRRGAYGRAASLHSHLYPRPRKACRTGARTKYGSTSIPVSQSAQLANLWLCGLEYENGFHIIIICT